VLPISSLYDFKKAMKPPPLRGRGKKNLHEGATLIRSEMFAVALLQSGLGKFAQY
jgi:hypothetical protein